MTRRRDLPRSFDELAGLRCRGLIRESTPEQGENSGPIVQERDERAFAARYGLLEPEHFYSDYRSGSDAQKRPEFLQMVADAKAGLFDVLLVYDTSRFARNSDEAGRYQGELHAAGVAVAYIADGQLSSARGKVVLAVKHALNEDWLDVHRDKVRQGYRVKRFEAGKFSGIPPIGYVLEYEDVYNPAKRTTEPRDTGRLIPDVEAQPRIGHGETYSRADLVRLIGKLYSTGQWGDRALAAHVNLLGYRNKTGEPFAGGSIRHILSSPTYAGYLSWHNRKDHRQRGEGPELVEGPHEALWSPELWKQIQAVRRRAFRGSAGGPLRYIYPFRRLALCERCGRRLYGEAHDDVPYMACITQRERHACDQRAVRSSVLEDQVGEWLATLRIPDDWREDIERMHRHIASADRPTIDRSKIQDQLDRLNDLYIMGKIGREEYVGRARALDQVLAGGTPQPTYSEEVLARAANNLRDLSAMWEKATLAERAQWCQLLFAEVRVRDHKIVGARLAGSGYLELVASSTAHATVSLARPEGFEPPTL
jgi:DNA invertase Pin-like site-specific DNA recombinase